MTEKPRLLFLAATLALAGCAVAPGPSPALPAPKIYSLQQLDSRSFQAAESAHVQYKALVGGTNVSGVVNGANFTGTSSVSGPFKLYQLLVTVNQTDATTGDPIFQTSSPFLPFQEVDKAFKITGGAKSAAIHLTTTVTNVVTNQPVAVAVDLNFEEDAKTPVDRFKSRFVFPPFTFTDNQSFVSHTANVTGTVSWDLGSGRTTVNCPAATVFASLNASTDKTSFKEN
ncbi:MAG: hypothetical protein JWM80_5926 [Cyanobacteria bacterium RYN_339]|nr:hypothetical protein [Cyanobacteria bacterium RYN_339]